MFVFTERLALSTIIVAMQYMTAKEYFFTLCENHLPLHVSDFHSLTLVHYISF